MCDFFSCIVMRSKQVFYSMDSDSHDRLIAENDLSDTTSDPQELSFARVEIIPDRKGLWLWEKDLSKWRFVLDERRHPEWFSPAHEEAAYMALRERVRDIDKSFSGGLNLGDYPHPLPESFTGCGGYLSLNKYPHPLPEGFIGCGGYLYLGNYPHPLPEGFTECGGDLRLWGYRHPLPEGFTECGGDLSLNNYPHPLPKGFTKCGGGLYLGNYPHPLPKGLQHAKRGLS